MFPEALLIGLGAALGSVIRWALTGAVGMDLASTLAVNVIGCGLMGYFRPGPFWGAGFLGGFTTMSAYALLTAGLPAPHALAYTAATVFGCLVAALLGRRYS